MHLEFYGRVAERLGRGLQNLLQRFESARDLIKTHLEKSEWVFCWWVSKMVSKKISVVKHLVLPRATFLPPAETSLSYLFNNC